MDISKDDRKTYTPATTPLTPQVIFFTIVCSMTAIDYISKGSNFLAHDLKIFANESLQRHYGVRFSGEEQMAWVRSVTVSMTNFANLIGSFLLPLAMDKLGRRATGLLLTNLLLVLACVMQVFSTMQFTCFAVL